VINDSIGDTYDVNGSDRVRREDPGHSPASWERTSPASSASQVLVELMEQRMGLEARLLEFAAALKQMKSARLPLSVGPAMAEMQRTIERFDADLTRLANVVHDLGAELERRTLLPEGTQLERVIFVRAGDRVVAVRVGEVAEIQAWHHNVRNHQREITSLSAALGLAPSIPEGNGEAWLLVLAGSHSALLVDEIIRQDEVVVRSLGPLLAGMKLYSGAAVAPRGELVLVVNTANAIESAAQHRCPD
jgi:hypothetical protein